MVYDEYELHGPTLIDRYFEVLALVSEGVSLDVRNSVGQTPLMNAANGPYLEIAELLINAGADIHCGDNDGRTALYFASYRGSVEIVQCLVNKGVTLDMKTSDGLTALMIAVYRANREVVELLINSGADIQCCDDDGRTALHYASIEESVEVVQCLLNKGAALDVKNCDGRTPLMLAVRVRHKEIVELLIKSGADIHCRDNNGLTLMHVAALNATQASIEIMQLLLKEGIDINVQALDGKTPLYTGFVSLYAQTDVVDYLLKAGADCSITDNRGESFFSLILQRNCYGDEIIKQCIENGAYVNSLEDFNKMLSNTLLKRVVLQDVKLCSQAVLNKFNNRDLPLLYKRFACAQKLPHIDKMKIVDGSRNALIVKQSVTNEIKAKGFCNLLEMFPPVLSMLCVKSYIEKMQPAFNQKIPTNHHKMI